LCGSEVLTQYMSFNGRSPWRFVLSLLVQTLLLLLFRCCTWTYLTFRLLASLLLRAPRPPPSSLLPAPLANSVEELVAGLEREFPDVVLPDTLVAEKDGPHVAVAFVPCSNLCLYAFGAAACLQRAKNYEQLRPRLRFLGTSSGALVAVALALDVDVPKLFERCLDDLDTLNARVGGWIGAYSVTISGIVEAMCRLTPAPKAHERASEGLQISVTALDPLPSRREITHFDSDSAVVNTLLASCYIPIVWEWPVWLPSLGLCLDGGASGFLVDGDLVVGPYHSCLPDVKPRVEFPRHLVFQPVGRSDLLRLFEEGWRDAARWAATGHTNRAQRVEKMQSSLSGVRTMLHEGLQTFLEVTGIKQKRS